MWDYPTSKSLWIRHAALCVLWLLMRRFCFARNKRSMSTGESGSTLPDKLQHYGLYLEECFDVSNFQDAFPHSPHICLSLPHGIGVSRLVICCITPSGMLQVGSTMEGFMSPSTSIMDESGVELWGRWQWWKVRFLKQRQRVSDHTAFLAAHPLIEMLPYELRGLDVSVVMLHTQSSFWFQEPNFNNPFLSCCYLRFVLLCCDWLVVCWGGDWSRSWGSGELPPNAPETSLKHFA